MGPMCFIHKGIWEIRALIKPSRSKLFSSVKYCTYTRQVLTCTTRACCNRCRADRGPPCIPQCPLRTRGPQTPAHKSTCTYPPATRIPHHSYTASRRSDPAARSAARCSRARRYTSSYPDSLTCTCHRWDRGLSHTSWPPESRTVRQSSRWDRCTRTWGWT